MGTGIISVLAGRFHFGQGTVTLEVLLLVFFFINLALFVVFAFVSVTRFCLYPELFTKMLLDPSEALFLGAVPVGVATLIDGALIMNQTYSFGGRGFTYSLWGFWWFALALSYLTAFGMIYILMSTRHHLITETTSFWVLPLIPLIVSSSTGGSLSQALLPLSPTLATLTTVFSLVALCMGMSLILMIITLFLTRLLLRGPPAPQVVFAGFVIASPLGMGGISLISNARTLLVIFPRHVGGTFSGIDLAGEMIYTICLCGAFVFWSLGLAWIAISVFTIISVKRQEDIPFSLSAWGAVFPVGVFARCTVELGVEFNSPFYNYFGIVWTGITLLAWISAFLPTLVQTWTTDIFPDITPIGPADMGPKQDFRSPRSLALQRHLHRV